MVRIYQIEASRAVIEESMRMVGSILRVDFPSNRTFDIRAVSKGFQWFFYYQTCLYCQLIPCEKESGSLGSKLVKL